MRWLLFILTAPIACGQILPMALLDTDRDGKISREELPEPLRPLFPLADSNGDGFISQKELEAFTASEPTPPPPLPKGMEQFNNLDYVGRGNTRQKLDLLLPAKRDGKVPVVVFIHGGGWLSGRKEDGIPIARQLAAAGYAVASINYRLATEALWPAQIHDCKAAIRFLRANAEKYGLDPDRIAAMGASAGGHLAAMLGTTGEDRGMEGEIGKSLRQSSGIRCVVNLFGPANLLGFVDPSIGLDQLLSEFSEARFLGTSLEQIKKNAADASPAKWISKDDVPFLTAHGTQDPLVPFSQSQELHAALTEAGVESHLVAMEGAGHGFEHPELTRRIRLFLDRHLRDQEVEIPSAPIRAQ